MLKQRTLKSLIRASGVGLHSGVKVTMALRPAAPDTGIVFRRVDLDPVAEIPALADLIATRLGKDPWLAATVTLVAVLGLLPYIALQLRAVAMSYSVLTATGFADLTEIPPWRDVGLYVALAMAVFAMLFGTRRTSAAEHNRGLVLAVAFESVLKLVAMLVLGLFVWGIARDMPALPPLPAQDLDGFMPLVLLGALAMFVLPHQFHVAVVENGDEADKAMKCGT